MSGVDSRIPVVASSSTSTKNPFTVINTTSSGVPISPFDDPGDWRFFGFSIGIIVIVLGTAGNGLTVWAYNNNRNLQTSFNVLIANLCFLELIFSLIIIPLQLPGYILQVSPYPEEVCTIIGFLYLSSITASLHNLIAIAINRYVGIADTKRYQKMFTGHRLRIWVVSIWLTSPLLHLPLVFGKNMKWDSRLLRCGMTHSASAPLRIYSIIMHVAFQATGLVVLIGLYSSIIKKVQVVKKKLKIQKSESLRRKTNKPDAKSPPRIDIEPTGTPSATSGDEAIEDYKPSSIISGGLQFRPAKDRKHDWASDSGHDSGHELGSRMHSRHLSDNTLSNSQVSHLAQSNEPLSPQPQVRRTSLWQALFRKKVKKESDEEEEQKCTFVVTAEDGSKKDVQVEKNSDETVSKDPLEDTTDKVEPINENSPDTVIMRNMDEIRKNMRRKKSISAPTLPSVEEIMQSSRKSSMAVAQNIPTMVTEDYEPGNGEISPRLTRASTVKSPYRKRFQRAANGSVRMSKEQQMKYLSPAGITNKLHRQNKNFCASMPTLTVPTEGSHKKVGSIARRIKDQRSGRKKKLQRRRQRARAIRRRHARERQLVYSSLTICVAFTLCILPASLLIVIQETLNYQVHAAVQLVISCISWLHSVVNPFVYGYMNHLYRKEYGRIAKNIEKKIMNCLK